MLARKRLSTGLTLHLVYVAVLTALLGLAGCGSTRVAGGDSPSAGKITVTISSLPNGQTGNAYTATLQAQGGTLPYKWSLTSGTLPAGLSLNGATGVISGTPTQSVANLSLSFTVTDSSATPLSTSVTLPLTIAAASSGITITTQSLPNGQMGVAYSGSLAASGGKSPYTWTLTAGTLPAGLTFNGATGAITGTPTAAATAVALTFKVMDSSSPAFTQTATLTMTIYPAGLVITTTSLPNGQVNVSYSAALTALGGTSPYTWSLTSGTLPAGLTLNAGTGAITGTPTSSVNALSLTFKVTDSGASVQTQTVNLTLTIAPTTLVITTSSLPTGQPNVPYNATLTASGGTTPYTWTISSGTLPAGLNLNAATGAITGTATSASATSLTFKVTDSGTQTKSATFTLTISSGTGTYTVSVTPLRAALAIGQTLPVTATTTDPSGVTWSGGAFSPSTSASGLAVTYTAPSTAGTYTLTATSINDSAASASITIYVTDLAGVYTYHNDLARDGANLHEYALSSTTVNTSTFGKLASCQVDGAIYAQPLWVANVSIGGGTHNVVIVATMHDSVYAFDADASPCKMYWQKSLLGPNETYGSSVDVNSGDIQPDIGILGTPVIDPAANIIYAVAKSKIVGTTTGSYHQRLHGLRVADGSEPMAAANIDNSVTVSGNCEGGTGVIAFNPFGENQRPGLALINGVVYIAWASHGDNPSPEWHGWVIGYSTSNLSAPAVVYNDSPAATGLGYCRAGIWMSGGAPAADANNNIYLVTGNGAYDGVSDFGDSVLRLTQSGNTLTVADWFTPHDAKTNLDINDFDLGSGGATILIDQPSAPHPQMLIAAGKTGSLFVLDRTNLGHFNPSDNVLQTLSVVTASFSTPAFWQNKLYFFGAVCQSCTQTWPGNAYTLTNNAVPFNTTPASSTPTTFGWPGATPSVSSSGATNGVLWALDNRAFCTDQVLNGACGPTILHAYDANNLATEFWNSSSVSADAAGYAVKFTVPTVANGKVYVGTRGNDNLVSGTVLGELDIYGLKPN